MTRGAHAGSHPSVNALTARSRQAVCRGRLIRLPGGAIGVRGLRVVAQAARGALRDPRRVRLSAWCRSRWSRGEMQTTGSVRLVRLTWPARSATDSTTDRQPTRTRDRAPRQRYRPTCSVPADARVAHLRCSGLRLWHHGSAHRGVHGDTSRAIVSLPSHGVMVCDISSDGPPQVSHNRSGAG